METWRLSNFGLSSPPDCVLHDPQHSAASGQSALVSSLKMPGSTCRARESAEAVTGHTTPAGFQDNPVRGGEGGTCQRGQTQAGRLIVACLKVGHTQKHCSETETRLGHLQMPAHTIPKSEANSL